MYCFRCSRPEVFCKKGVLRNFAKFTEKQLCQSLFFSKVAGRKSSHRRCSVKKMFLNILQNSQEKTCARVSFLIKLQASCNFIKKETPTQVFSCEFCEISKNTFFTEHLRWLLLLLHFFKTSQSLV